MMPNEHMSQPQRLALTKILEEIRTERFRQVGKGWTPEHDADHSLSGMVRLAADRAGNGGFTPDREQLVAAAAILVAAIEANDRSVI